MKHVKALAVAVTLLVGCASMSAQQKELIALNATKASIAASFAAFYTIAANQTLQEVKASMGTLEEYDFRMQRWNDLQGRIIAILQAIDAASKAAAAQIDAGATRDVLGPLRVMVKGLATVMASLNIPVAQ